MLRARYVRQCCRAAYGGDEFPTPHLGFQRLK
jgi:hypothetical protein